MKLVRLAVVLVAALLLGGGYAASQAAFFGQTTGAYVRALDASPVPLVALVLLAAAVILAFLPSQPEESL